MRGEGSDAKTVFVFAFFALGCGTKWTAEDLDGDSVSAAEGDCWDQAEGPAGSGLSGSDIWPGAQDTWYDGFDQDCAGNDDYDVDGDGFVPDEYVGLATLQVSGSGGLAGGDCWDDSSSQSPEVTITTDTDAPRWRRFPC